MDIFNQKGELNQEAIEVLYELGNMGVATAVTPIGNIREIKINVGIPEVRAIKKDILSEIEYDPEQIVIGVSTKLDTTINGSVLFLLSKDFIKNTVYEMTEMEFQDDELMKNEDSVSAISEIVNYMTAGYAKVIGSYLNTPIYICGISIGLNKVGTIIENMEKRSGSQIDKIACVNTKFTIKDEKGKDSNESGQVLMFPDQACIAKFMELIEE